MSDYEEQIEIKEIGIVSLKVKTKKAEIIIFDEEIVDISETFENKEVKKNVEKFYEDSVTKLRKQYGNEIPQDELKKTRNIVDAMNIYLQTQSSFDDKLFEKLRNKISVIKAFDGIKNNEDFLKTLFKEMLYIYIKEKTYKNDCEKKIESLNNKGFFYHFKMLFVALFREKGNSRDKENYKTTGEFY